MALQYLQKYGMQILDNIETTPQRIFNSFLTAQPLWYTLVLI